MSERVREGSGDETILELEDVTMRIRERKLLPHTDFSVRRGEQWAVLGPNGSGKSTFARTIAGILPSASGHIHLREEERVRLVSFEAQAELYAREIELDHGRRFAGRTDELLTVRGLIGDETHAGGFAGGLEVDHLLDRPFRYLSAGEMRKALIARALVADPTLLVLDEPFDGLDRRSRVSLSRYLERLIAEGRHLILVTHRDDELLPGITHVLLLREGEVVGIGTRAEMLDPGRIAALYAESDPDAENGEERAPEPGDRQQAGSIRGNPAESGNSRTAPIISFRKVSVRYDGTTVLADLSFSVRCGERWGITGPNGCGKTTILSLIVGDNLQGYANEIELFGRPKGSGESIWEIKRRIGLVTPHLQLAYRPSIPGIEVVLSGLFDSVGLYRRPSDDEVARARRTLEQLGISALAERPFGQLSYGQRRLLLIARALVKEPGLLILDEPCQGLDPPNRRRVLRAIESACVNAEIALLYVTHHEDERPRCLTHLLRLTGPGEAAEIVRLSG